MTTSSPAFRPRATRTLGGSLLLAAFLLGGCGDDDKNNNNNGGGNASTAYVGLLASTDGQTGPLDLTFASPVSAPPTPLEPGSGPMTLSALAVNVTGTLRLGSGPLVNVTGVLDDNDALAMSGGGYTLFGDLEHGMIVGGFSGPGPVSGSLIAASSTDGSPALALCGTFAGTNYDSDPPSEDFGTFNLVIAGTSVLGVAVGSEGDAIPLQGTATSSTITINMSSAEGTITATGEYDEFGVGGAYTVKVGTFTLSEGSFSGGTCDQPT